MTASFDYAVLRVVPRVERQEFVNIGVIVFCLERRFLQAKVQVDEARLHALWPALDVALIQRHADAVVRVCTGDAEGEIASLSLRERFHWLTSPRSTVIQTSAIHTGICGEDGAEAMLERLFQQLVAVE
ncbi:DUF3037 domain-containing protein [Silvibacterium dinghuense]|uniref:DUF3037 domain-containing protein n=1 Tax=Silvibacterium dinghuense TaxID=1560006 RepID=A0A4Q1S8V3_9BACT|nr:DUF3037 domain-containing protein [Silvibacterium dinghuense]RXS93319.1 DUF3037 domain-containing protein [Silvibacterium dinghuense]GGH04873.1 hypothetical protein GCM10011586_21190 [Silvibacterium dinghuense]